MPADSLNLKGIWTMKVNLMLMRGHKSPQETKEVVDKIFKQSSEAKDPIYISDLMLEPNWAKPIMDRIRSSRDRIYKLKVLKDEWGKPVKPGDLVYRIHKKSLYESPDKPHSSAYLSSVVKSGKWKDTMEDHESFEVDKKGCISCTGDDMFYFLSHFGIHSISRERLSFHPNETSSGPVTLPNGNGMKHVWYWRYEEWDREMYDTAPVMQADESQRIDVKNVKHGN